MSGNNVSHSNNRTKRKFHPNLQTKKFFVPETGETVILKVSANAIRTIDKKGIAAVLAETSELAGPLFDRAMTTEQRNLILPKFIENNDFHLAVVFQIYQ